MPFRPSKTLYCFGTTTPPPPSLPAARVSPQGRCSNAEPDSCLTRLLRCGPGPPSGCCGPFLSDVRTAPPGPGQRRLLPRAGRVVGGTEGVLQRWPEAGSSTGWGPPGAPLRPFFALGGCLPWDRRGPPETTLELC